MTSLIFLLSLFHFIPWKPAMVSFQQNHPHYPINHTIHPSTSHRPAALARKTSHFLLNPSTKKHWRYESKISQDCNFKAFLGFQLQLPLKYHFSEITSLDKNTFFQGLYVTPGNVNALEWFNFLQRKKIITLFISRNEVQEVLTLQLKEVFLTSQIRTVWVFLRSS